MRTKFSDSRSELCQYVSTQSVKEVCMDSYPNLFQPLQLGRTVLKNRIEAAPVSVSNLTPQAHYTPENIAVFERRARGI